MYKRTPRVAWNDQKKSAINRGIWWNFTFEEWIAWWQRHLGRNWFKLRGYHTGQYVMARKGDKGPYTKSNVRCIRVEDNHNEYNLTKISQAGKSHRGRLPFEIVKAVYEADGRYADIAKQFGLNEHSVHRIKCQKAYKAITAVIEKGGSR